MPSLKLVKSFFAARGSHPSVPEKIGPSRPRPPNLSFTGKKVWQGRVTSHPAATRSLPSNVAHLTIGSSKEAFRACKMVPGDAGRVWM